LVSVKNCTKFGKKSLICIVALATGLVLMAGCGGTSNTGTSMVTPVTIVTKSLPAGVAGQTYGAAIQAVDGMAPYTYAVTGGTLPAGLSLNGSVIQGVPSTVTTSNVTITVTDSSATKTSAAYTLAIGAPPPPILTLGASVPVAVANTSYSSAVTISGGTAPYTFSLASGSMPAGLTLSPTGAVTGTPTASGSFYFSVHAVDSSFTQGSVYANVAITVADAGVTVNMASPVVTVPTTFYGIHTSVYDSVLNDTANIPVLLADTGVAMMRYPGGGFSDNYHWAQHSITPFYASTNPACNVTADGYISATAHFGSFVQTMLASKAGGIITVNYGTSVADSKATKSVGTDGQATCSEPNTFGQPQEAAAWVAYANGSPSSTQVIGLDAAGFDWKTVGFWAGLRASGPLAVDDGYNFLRIGHAAAIGIKYWEIGNEMYYNGWSGNHNAETDLHAPYIYPNGYTGSFNSRDQLAALSPTSYGQNAVQFIQAMKAVDPTILVGLDFDAPGATDPIPANWNPDLANAACGAGAFDMVLIHYYPGTYKNVQPSELVSLPQTDIPNVVAGIKANLAQYCPAIASKIQFWMTETSPNGALATNFPTPVLGLFVIDEYLTAMANGYQNADWLELHNGTFLDNTEAPGPVFYAIQMMHQMAAPGDSLVTATSTNGTVLSWGAVKTTGKGGVILMNTSPTNSQVVQLTFSGASVGTLGMQYALGINTVQSGTALSATPVTISGGTLTVTVPAYTAVEVVTQ
jgi:hypothetical protein